jgi:hypothetical protein
VDSPKKTICGTKNACSEILHCAQNWANEAYIQQSGNFSKKRGGSGAQLRASSVFEEKLED